MGWTDKEAGKLYSKRYYAEHKAEVLEYQQKYREEHREELRAKRKEYNRRYEERHPKPTDKKRSEAQDRQYRDMRSGITNEEWLKRYGYPMGDTSGWENWVGWDRRIRRGEEE